MAESIDSGHFVWYELMTTDTGSARAFYTDVVGWGTTPFEGGPIPYTMWTKGETPVGGFLEMPAEAGEYPPTWMAHVGVDDVDATAARVEEKGGTIVNGPEDVPDVGRFVVFTDPQGAVISAFRAENASPPAEPEPGDVSWHELATTDPEAALGFYSDLFGWEKQDALDMGGGAVYQMFGHEGRMLGGVYDLSAGDPEAAPDRPAWLYYIRVADLDQAIEKVEAGGGTILIGPMEVPGGSRVAVGRDPQGAAFGLHGA